MSSARHFNRPASNDQLKAEIKADAAAARKAQQQMKAAGQYALAARMGEAVDEHLDELNDANNGTWTPKHA